MGWGFLSLHSGCPGHGSGLGWDDPMDQMHLPELRGVRKVRSPRDPEDVIWMCQMAPGGRKELFLKVRDRGMCGWGVQGVCEGTGNVKLKHALCGWYEGFVWVIRI